MKLLQTTGPAAIVAALLCSTAVRADVTAEQVWNDWVAYYEDLGQSVSTTSQGMQGDTLVIQGAAFTSAMTDATSRFTIDEVRLRNLGDGTVEVTLSDLARLAASSTANGETTDMTINVTEDGMKMIVSGNPGDMTYDFSAIRIGIDFAEMKVNGEPVPMKVSLGLNNNAGTSRMQSGDQREVNSDFTAESLDMDISASDPKAGGAFDLKGMVNALHFTTNAKFAGADTATDLNTMLKAGMDASGSMTYGAGSYTMDFKDGEQTMNMVASAASGALTFAMSSAGLAYAASGTDTKIAINSNQIPMPMDLSIAQTAFDFAMPVTKGDGPQPFKLMMKVGDLAVSDSLWSMIDPTAQLPHDPATVVIDASGTADLNVDLFDQAQMAAMGTAGTMPAQIDSLDLNALQLKVAGADLTGTGAVTFDNAGPTPMPIGAVDLKLVGGNALIDKLVAMGLIPEDQAMGARMMLGLFAVPAGDDVLTSKLEFKEGGSIFANGQQIQ